MLKVLGCASLVLLFLAGCDDQQHHAPVAQDMTLATDEDTYVERSFDASDEDGDPIAIQILEPPRHGTLDVAGLAFVYTPALNYNGTDSFRYRARSILVNSEPATVSLAVRPVNDRPTSTAIAPQTLEDQPVTFTVPMSDVDGDALTLIAAGAGGGTLEVLDARAGTARFTPDANFNGSATAIFHIVDTVPEEALSVLTDVTVTPVNDPPVAVDDLATAKHGDWVMALVTSNDRDVDHDQLTVQSVGSTPAGQVAISAGGIRFTPDPDFLGATTVDYEVADPSGAVSVAHVTFEVRLNQALLFVADREAPGVLELFRYDGMDVQKVNLPFAANERLIDFRGVSDGEVLYRTREGFTNHLYRREFRPGAPATAVRISAHNVDGFYRVGRAWYYVGENTLYRADPVAPEPMYTPALSGEFISSVVDDRFITDAVYLSTVQFNPSLGVSSLKRLSLSPPHDVAPPLLTAAAPASITGIWFAMPARLQPPPTALVYGASVGGARALYSIPSQGGMPIQLSPFFGLGENFSAARAVPNRSAILYRANVGSNDSNIYLVNLSAPGVHAQVSIRSSSSQDLGGYVVNSAGTRIYYPLSDGADRDRRVYVSSLDFPGTGQPVSPSEPTAFGAHDLYLHPQETQLLYLTQATAAGPSRLVLLDDLLGARTVRNLRDAGTTLEQLRVPEGWRAAALQERGANGDSLLLVSLLGAGQVRTLHSPAPGDIGVTALSFEEF